MSLKRMKLAWNLCLGIVSVLIAYGFDPDMGKTYWLLLLSFFAFNMIGFIEGGISNEMRNRGF